MVKSCQSAMNVERNTRHIYSKIPKKEIDVESVEKNYKQKELPSIEIALYEARARYDLEYDRLCHLDNKITSFLTVASILIAFLTIYELNTTHHVIISLFSIASMIGLIVIMFFSVKSLWLKSYHYVVQSGFFNLAKWPKFDLQKQMLGRYNAAILENIEANDKKVKYITISSYLLFVALCLIIISMILSIFIG